jgi:anti-sigma regulatory factor (Ser/Thr protein kinase)
MKGRKDNLSPLNEGQLIATLGHELGNVLNGLLGMTRLVRSSDLNAEQDRWLKAIEQSGRQLSRLLESLRDAPSESCLLFHPTPAYVDGVDLLEQVLLSHAPAARDSKNLLLLTVSPDVPRDWHVDPRLLRQLIDNLLGNALKYTAAGEVVLEVRKNPGAVTSSGGLVLTVIDSGPGIDSELGDRMFNAHERGPQQVREKSGGQGLGLFVCKRIAQALNGKIRWSTPATGGSCFTVSLPSVLAATHPPSPLPSQLIRLALCRLELSGQLQRSVAGCLARLGAPVAADAQGGCEAADELSPRALTISITEGSTVRGEADPGLMLEAAMPGGQAIARRNLQAPVLESNLGPLLLELILQSLWVRDAKGGSAP